ncbi:uncharacterized protein MONBRDRAFT_29161 [Monosiga brevicollis MX1]|uniref:Uncharacterized protein n=1 Tax=Monosiga brevicollis TaxID=81824 RepID=A9VAA6_MONBE|nr:uncharacterized protein MONBRDRAFT_29161 [Monosiga brevicollis MX1]EDQ85507.1 predicted protein [Monosiga brevicollis MX1]|eukprot:XP_001749698.1 hypothetical protein [Monosiga brevicollis MX1]
MAIELAVELIGAVAFVLGVDLVTAGLYAVVPGPRVKGYACDRAGEPLPYVLNGLRVYVAGLMLVYWLHQLELVPLDYIATHFWSVAMAANVVGLVTALGLVLWGLRPGRYQGARRCLTADQAGNAAARAEFERPHEAREQTFGFHYYTGTEFNPRFGALDIKMYLYLVGALLLHVTLLSALARHVDMQPDGAPSRAMVIYQAMFAWFIVEYIYHEHVHLYTYDLFAEKVGFKLTWGCLVFYPFFYSVGVWSLVPALTPEADLSITQCLLVAVLFLVGWIMTRGANMQKYYFKLDPRASFLGVRPVTVPGTRILCSGFWGASRHLNYLGEILQGLALALPGVLATGSLWPLLYPAYYVALFIPRQIEDDEICAAKYGSKWAEYVRRVPYRIIPFIY